MQQNPTYGLQKYLMMTGCLVLCYFLAKMLLLNIAA